MRRLVPILGLLCLGASACSKSPADRQKGVVALEGARTPARGRLPHRSAARAGRWVGSARSASRWVTRSQRPAASQCGGPGQV